MHRVERCIRTRLKTNQNRLDEMRTMDCDKFSRLRSFIGILMLAVLAACAQQGALTDVASGTAAEGITARYPEDGFQSVESADRALAEVRTERERIRQQFAQEEQSCYERFFTNRCLDDLKERERSALEQLRRVEVNANAYKRREKVERRDERSQQRENRRLNIPAGAAPVGSDSDAGASKEVQAQ